jgi:hypothetical protein
MGEENLASRGQPVAGQAGVVTGRGLRHQSYDVQRRRHRPDPGRQGWRCRCCVSTVVGSSPPHHHGRARGGFGCSKEGELLQAFEKLFLIKKMYTPVVLNFES